METVEPPRLVLAKAAAVMALAQVAVGVVGLFAAADVTPVARADGFRLFAVFALSAAAAMLLLTLANLGAVAAPLRSTLTFAAIAALAVALARWLIAVAHDPGTTWLWLGAPLFLINSWVAIRTWKSRAI
jgi:type IV secretory pathway TraG/TraD family ATPase VirD4